MTQDNNISKDEQHAKNMTTSIKAHPFVLDHACNFVKMKKEENIHKVKVYEKDSWNGNVDEKDYEGIDFEIHTTKNNVYQFGNRTRSRYSSGFFTDFSLRAMWDDKFTRDGFNSDDEMGYPSEIEKVVDKDNDKVPDYQVMTRIEEDRPNSLFIVDIDDIGKSIRNKELKPVKPTDTTPVKSQGIDGDCAFYFDLDDLDDVNAVVYSTSYMESGQVYYTEPTPTAKMYDTVYEPRVKCSLAWFKQTDNIDYVADDRYNKNIKEEIIESIKD